MKTKFKNYIYLIICLLMISGVLFTNGTGSANNSSGNEGLGWRQYAGRESQFYSSPFAVEGSVSYIVGTEVPLLYGKLSMTLEIIDCCSPNKDPHSWCNYDADDPRCAD
ncbi:MAG: hypothetical protein V2A67_03235 [Bacteroidota bacterium]